ncbi:hypothetical protein CRUP_031245 [Coryphaenoides rupestris]|nr:hypothetical protein CRUP_031245 [Coryphaenoides rupestris]
MAPVNLVGELSSVAWTSSPVLAVISTVVFLSLCITLLTLCVRCQRKPENAYSVNTEPDGNVAKSGDAAAFTTWRSHSTMPANSMETPAAATIS